MSTKQNSATAPPAADHEITLSVVTAVADAANVRPTDLDPLTTAIDPDALESMVRRMDGGSEGPTSFVQFRYSGYEVTVTGDEGVVVSDPDSGEELAIEE